jgi:hypothetical protein
MLYAPGSFSGNYIPQGNVADADCVIGNEFAYRKNGYGNVNIALAEFIASRYIHLPMFLNRNIAGALGEIMPGIEPEEIFDGNSAGYIATKGHGTWAELAQARYAMNERRFNRPILVAQAYHVGRVALQAELLEMEPIVPEGLPRDFDPESEQPWTRGRLRWAIREAAGAPILRHRAQL